MTAPYAPPAPFPVRPPRRTGVKVGLAMVATGIVLGVAGIVAAIAVGASTHRYPVPPTGGSTMLDAGSYEIYAEYPRAKTERYDGPIPEVVGPSGPVLVRTSSYQSTGSRNGRERRRIGRFEAAVDGTYWLEVASAGEPSRSPGPDQFVVEAEQPFEWGILVFVFGMLGGGFLFVIGIIVLIVASVRSASQQRAWAPAPQHAYPHWANQPGRPAVPVPVMLDSTLPPPPGARPSAPPPAPPSAEPPPLPDEPTMPEPPPLPDRWDPSPSGGSPIDDPPADRGPIS